MPPSKGRIVIVVTPGRIINGQEEHAAIVTQVWGTTETAAINVTVFPSSGEPFTIGSVIPEQSRMPGGTSPFWRWPERT